MGIKWSAVSYVGRRALALLVNIIMARLLSPADFGLVAMAAVILGLIELFRDLGTASALIQRKVISEELVSSLFWFNFTFGLVAAAVVFVCSPVAGWVYREVRVVYVLQALSISFPVSALSIVHASLLERELAFDKLARVEVASALFASATGIGSAIAGAGVWSLVLQLLAGNLMMTTLLWFTVTWRPKCLVQWAALKSVMTYSLNLTASNILNYFARNADNLLIGRYLGAQDLGFYDLGYRLMITPLQGISAVIGRVMFPLLSRMQDNLEKFRNVYLEIAGAIALLSFPMMLGLGAASEQFVLALFGTQWKAVIPLLMILAPLGALQSIMTTGGGIYQATGRTDWLFYWGCASSGFIIVSFIIGLRWGIVGVAAAYAVVNVILTYPGFAIPFRLIGLRLNNLIKVLWRPAVCSLLMLAVLLGLQMALPVGLSPGLSLVILMVSGFFVYALATWFLNRKYLLYALSVAR